MNDKSMILSGRRR